MSKIQIPKNSTTKLINTTTDINVFIDRHNVSQFFSDETISFLEETMGDTFNKNRYVNILKSYAIDSNSNIYHNISTEEKKDLQFQDDDIITTPLAYIEESQTKEEERNLIQTNEKQKKLRI